MKSSSVLVRYEPQGILGVGPLGKIYAATESGTGRRVAFRGFRRPKEADEATWGKAIEKLNRELSAARKLEHPGIARIFDFGEEEGLYYVITEWFEGEPLSVRLQRGEKFAPDDALNLIGQAGRSVEYAIEEGAVHGDLTPFNLIITKDGAVRIVNYGLASCRPKDDSVYRSPEELLGHEPGPRSDLFALGVLLHTMLEGVHPFGSGSPAEVQQRMLQAPPAPAASAPPYLQGILARMLAKRPGDRYETWAEVAADIINSRAPAPAPPPSPGDKPDPPAPAATPSISQFKLTHSDIVQMRKEAEQREQEKREQQRLARKGRLGCGGTAIVMVCLALLLFSGYRGAPNTTTAAVGREAPVGTDGRSVLFAGAAPGALPALGQAKRAVHPLRD